MKVIHIISSISRLNGGPSRSSRALVAALSKAGCEAFLLTSACLRLPYLRRVVQ